MLALAGISGVLYTQTRKKITRYKNWVRDFAYLPCLPYANLGLVLTSANSPTSISDTDRSHAAHTHTHTIESQWTILARHTHICTTPIYPHWIFIYTKVRKGTT